MSTTNTTITNYTVENLVAKYRNYVDKHCPKSYDVSEWTDKEGKAHFEEIYTPCSPEANVEEQLLIVIYKTVVGDNAQKEVVDALSQFSNAYYPNVLSEDEIAFLCENYKETIEYLFAHRDEWTAGIKYHLNTISKERERLVKEYTKQADGSTVFIADTEYCDLAVHFPNCIIKGFTGLGNNETKTAWALGQIRMWAAGIKSEIVSGEKVDGKYEYTLPEKGSVDCVIFRVNENKYYSQGIMGTQCTDVEALYDLLKPGGKMLFFSDSVLEMAGTEYDGEIKSYKSGKEMAKDRLLNGTRNSDNVISKFRHRIVRESAVESIISYEDDNHLLGDGKASYIMLVISKRENEKVCIRNEKLSISKVVSANDIDGDILWPNYYLTDKPIDAIPLSQIVSFYDLNIHRIWHTEDNEFVDEIKNKDRALYEKLMNVLVAIPADMATDYKDANLCYANLKKVGDSVLEKWRSWIRFIDKPCTLLYGNETKYVVGYVKDLSEEKVATLDTIVCLVPKEGIDVRYVSALLLTQEVKHQITSVCDGKVNDQTFPLVINKIMVPNHDEKERLAFLAEANYNAMLSSQKELKQENVNYTKAVRMRKHALTQKLFAMKATFSALNAYRNRQNGQMSENDRVVPIKETTVRDAFELISKDIEVLRTSFEHIADVEYTFSKPEWINPEQFIEDYISKNTNEWLNFKPVITWEKGHNSAKDNLKDMATGEIILKEGDALNSLYFPKDALEKVMNNIVANATSHGFTEHERNDYQLRFSWHYDGIAIIIEIENNGTPIPRDRNTASLLEYGVSTALHKDGHNGIGCNEIDDIMRRYDGKVKIESSPESDFTVKYVLTFERSNIIRQKNIKVDENI